MEEAKSFVPVSFSIVILAQNHNPTILNPDFLKLNKIVPEDYKVKYTVTTPPFSIVQFENGLVLTVEIDKFQVTHDIRSGFDNSKTAIITAIEYVKTLKHVGYRNVGLNWIGYFEQRDSVNWIRSRFIADGIWSRNPYEINDVGIRFSYGIDSHKCNLNFASKYINKGEEQISIVDINANYHHDLPDKYPNAEVVVDIINGWQKELEHFKEILKVLLGIKA